MLDILYYYSVERQCYKYYMFPYVVEWSVHGISRYDTSILYRMIEISGRKMHGDGS